MDWLKVLIFGVIPVLTVVLVFCVKRKLLWIAPLFSTAAAFVTYMITFRVQGMHSPITKIFSNNEWRGFFLLAMLMHLGLVVGMSVIVYLVTHILKQKQK